MMMLSERTYDRIIIGAGLYGLYAARLCGEKGEKVLVLEKDPAAFSRATYINQARVHMGYHYPRSLSTAMKSAGYFRRFCDDFGFCVHRDFSQIYATSAKFSWTDADQFVSFCEAAGIPCEETAASRYFNPEMCSGAFITKEYTYDAAMLRDYYLKILDSMPGVRIIYDAAITDIFCNESGRCFEVTLADGARYEGGFLFNSTYASTNQITSMVRGIEHEYFDLKYELCEIILTEPGEDLKDIGLTVMDGPFFSIMPFGMTGMHSLTSVSFTPHMTSYKLMPEFGCQKSSDGKCNQRELANCSACPFRPESAWPYMDRLARKYILPRYGYKYIRSLFSMKPILKSSEIDDSRPTSIKVDHRDPGMVSVLSGKINTVYDIDEYLK